MLTTEQKFLLSKIQRQLEHGDRTKIIERLKSKSTASEVYAVLNGKYYKDLVIDAALDVIAENVKMKSNGKIALKVKQKAAVILG